MQTGIASLSIHLGQLTS